MTEPAASIVAFCSETAELLPLTETANGISVTEPASSVASCSENAEEEKSLPILPKITIGIDIGTSPCSVSVLNGSQVRIFKNIIHEMIKRSSETSDDRCSSTEVSSGDTVSEEHEETIFNMKRWEGMIGSMDLPFLVHALDNNDHPFIAAFVNKVWRSTSDVEFLVKFLVELRLMVETKLKRPIGNVVFTVPVSFSRMQITRIHRACAIAGLEVLKVIPQPTAVALLYGRLESSDTQKITLSFNMDSAYCDVAVIATWSKGKYQIKALAGSTIGGEDLLGNMIRYLLPNSENIFKNDFHGDKEIKSLALLRRKIQEAITLLSSKKSVEVNLDLGDGLKIYKVIRRAEFVKVNEEVFDRCERLIIGCLQDAKVKVEDINDVIIIGGCSHIPMVKYLISKICKGNKLYKGINPLGAAVTGAAVAGAFALKMVYFHITPLAIGIRANGNNFVPVIPRNTVVPKSKRVVFTTIHDNQTEAFIAVYEGMAQKAEENQFLGYFKITDIPEAPKGVLEIQVCMGIDHKNRLTVIASVVMARPQQYEIPIIETKNTKIDDGQLSWCDESLLRTYYSDTMGLNTY